MTWTAKRRIAREWLILLACIVISLFVTYGALYFGRSASWDYMRPDYSEPIPAHQHWLIKEENAGRNRKWPEDSYYTLWHDYFCKPKNPGDLFNDLWPIIYRSYYSVGHYHYEWDEEALRVWFFILSPYFGLLFVRSIIWSVNTVRRH